MRFLAPSSLLLWAATGSLTTAHSPHGAHLKHKHKRGVDARIPWTTADGPLPTKLVVFKQIVEVYGGSPHTDKPASFFYETLLTPNKPSGGQTSTGASGSASGSGSGGAPTSTPPGQSYNPGPGNTSGSSSSSTSSSQSAGYQPPPPNQQTTTAPTATSSGNNANPSSGSPQSSTSAAAPPPGGNGGGGGKAICWDKGTEGLIKSSNLNLVSSTPFNHNWDAWDPTKYAGSVGPSNIGGQYIPMLKGFDPNADNTWAYTYANFPANVKAWGSKVDMILTFNEPDFDALGQDTVRAAAEFIKMAQPFVGQMSVVAPSPTSTRGSAIKWAVDFFTNCNGKCTPTHLATNYYAINCDPSNPAGAFGPMDEYLHSFRTAVAAVYPPAASLPFVLPEVGCRQSTPGGAAAFLTYLKSHVDSKFITRYFWFGVVPSNGGENSGGLLSGGDVVQAAYM